MVKMELLKLIPKGRENAITRQQLCNLTGWGDRKVRGEIKKLVRDGYPILSLSESPGYWYSSDIDEIERFLREVDSRNRSEYLTTARLRRLVNEARGENTVHVRAHTRRIHKRDEIEGQVSI